MKEALLPLLQSKKAALDVFSDIETDDEGVRWGRIRPQGRHSEFDRLMDDFLLSDQKRSKRIRAAPIVGTRVMKDIGKSLHDDIVTILDRSPRYGSHLAEAKFLQV